MEPKIVPPGSGRVLNVLGDNQTLRLTGAETGGTFALVELNNPPGVGIPMHLHKNEEEMFHVLEGEMEFTVADKSVIATAGTTVFLPRDVPHEFKVVGEVPAKALVTVVPAGIEDMFQELSELPAGPPDMEKVLAICERHGVIFL
jgi:quercetin dioxygenase-like cupin family protein